MNFHQTGNVVATLTANSGTATLNVASGTLITGGAWSAGMFDIDATGTITLAHNVTSQSTPGAGIDAIDINSSGANIVLNAGVTLSSQGSDPETPASGPIKLTSHDMVIDTSGSPASIKASEQVFFLPNSGRTVDLGADATGQYKLTDAELDRVFPGSATIRVGDLTTGNVLFTAEVNMTNADKLFVTSGGAINDTGSSTVYSDVSLGLSSGSTIGNTSPLNLSTTNLNSSSLGNTDITQSGDVSVNDVVGIAGLGMVSTTGSVSLESAGSITISSFSTGSTGFTLYAQGGDAGDVIVNAEVSSATGNILIRAHDDITGDSFGNLRVLDDSNPATNNRTLTLTADLDLTDGGTISYAGLTQLSDNGSSGTFSLSDTTGVVSGVISGVGSLIKVGTGTLTLSGANTYSGSTTVTAGILVGTTTSLQGNFTNNATLTFSQGFAGSFSGVISGTGAVVIAGTSPANDQVTFSGTNTYTGSTSIVSGELAVTSAQGMGATSAGTTVSSGARLRVLAAATISEPVTVNAGGTLLIAAGAQHYAGAVTLNGTLRGISGASLDGPLTLTGNSTVSNDSAPGEFTINGAISESAGSFGINYVPTFATAVILLTNTGNSYTGSTQLTGPGVLRIGASNVISDASAVVLTSGTFELNDFSEAIGSLAGSRPVTLGSGTLTVGGDHSSTSFSGVISGTGGVTKTGNGTLTLSGNHTFTGMTSVGAGTLLLTGSLADGTASPDVSVTGGTLQGTGTIGGTVTVSSSGHIAPGTSPGILNSGDVSFASGSFFDVEIGGTTAGNAVTNHDQLNVTGTVSLGGATLNLSAFNGFVPVAGDKFTILMNDSGDAVTGTFNGLIEGATISNFLGSGLSATISYASSADGNDGNDVVLSVAELETSVTLDGSNKLVITDTNGGASNDTLTIQSNTATSQFIITAASGTISTAIAGATGNGTNSVSIPFGSVGGSQIFVNTLVGNDSLTIDLSLGNFGKSITFDGGDPTSGPADSLTLTGGSTFATVTHTFTSASVGTIAVTGNSTISYLGLEPITDNLSATDRIFTFNGGTETITLTDAAGSAMTIDSTLGESLTFANPTSSLTINMGSGNDILNVTSINAGYNVGLVINGDAGNDTVNFNADLTFASGHSLDIDLTNDASVGDEDQINVGSNANLLTSGTGAVTFKASRNIVLNSGSSLETVNGGITLNANASGAQTADFIGIDSNSATIQTTGTGNILIVGHGSETGGNSSNMDGVNLRGGTSIRSTATGASAGTITIQGTGGNGSDLNVGVRISGLSSIVLPVITSANGAIGIQGTGGGDGAGSNNHGVFITAIDRIESTGTGLNAATITIVGTGGNGVTSNNGAALVNSTTDITSIDGDITITGTGGTGSIGGGNGVDINSIEKIESTGTGPDAAVITITGMGGMSPGGGNTGVFLIGSSTDVTSAVGSITIFGTGGTGLGGNTGVSLVFDSSMQVGTGSLTVTGLAGNSNSSYGSYGLELDGSSGGRLASTGSGPITVTATGSGTFDDLIAGADSLIGDATHVGAASAATGTITINANSVTLSGSMSVETDGSLTIKPRTASTTIGLGGGSGGLNLIDTELSFLQDGFSAITIGDATNGTGAIDVDSSTFTDPVTIVGGSIAVTELNAGSNAVTLTARSTNITDGGDTGADITGGAVTLNAGGTIGASGNQLSLAATTLVTNSTLNSANGNQFFSEADSLTIASGGVNAGTGTITLGGGTFTLGGADRINDTAAVSLSGVAGTNLDLAGFNETIGSLSGGGAIGGNVSLGSGTLTTGDSTSTTYAGVISGTGGLTKSGTGTQTLSGANTFTGNTTVGSGRMNVTGSLASGSAVTVQSTGTLGGTGTVAGTVSVQSGGHIAPGTSPGILNSGSVSFASGSLFDVEVGGTSPGNAATNHDQLNVTGTVSLGNATLTTTAFNAFVPVVGDTFTILVNDGSDAVTGTFNGLDQGATISNFLGSGLSATISYTANTDGGTVGNDVVLTVTANLSPTLSINDVQVTEGNSGRTTLNFTVTLSAAKSSGFTVRFATQDGTATVANGDYQAISGSSQLRVGSFNATRGGTFSLSDGNSAVAMRAAIQTNFAGATITGTSTLTSAFLANIDVLWLNSVSSNSSATVALSAAEQAALLSFVNNGGDVLIFGENNVFDDESLLDPFGATSTGLLSETQSGTITNMAHVVTNGPFGVVQTIGGNFPGNLTTLGSATSLGTWDSSGQTSVAVIDPGVLSAGSGRVVLFSDVNFYADQLGTADNSKLLLNALSATQSSNVLTFAGTAGETQTIQVLVNGDTQPESDESFSVLLSNLTGNNQVTIADGTGVGTITNDDAAPVAPVVNDQTLANLAENSVNGTVVGTVVASDPGDVLTYSILSGNTGGAFAINSSTGQITVANSASVDFETTPTFLLTVQVQDLSGLTDTAVITINLNDLQGTLSINDVTQAEGNSGTSTMTFTATLSGATGAAFQVPFQTADGTATTTNSDYVSRSSSNSLVIGAFDGTRGGSFSLSDGANAALMKAAILANFPGATIVGTNTLDAAFLATVNVVWLNSVATNTSATSPLSANEQAALLSFVNSGGGAVIFGEHTAFDDSSLLSPFGLSTDSSVDQFVTGTITNPTHPVTHGPFGDVLTLNANYAGNLTNLGSATSLGTWNSSGLSALAVLSSGAGNVVVMTDVNLYADRLQEADNSKLLLNAVAFVRPTGSLQFVGTAGETQSITVTINGDGTFEGDETVSVLLTSIVGSNDVTILDGTGTGTIQNDDLSGLVRIGNSLISEHSGKSNAVFEVNFSSPSLQPVTYSTAISGSHLSAIGSGLSATAGKDFKSQTGTIRFAPGQTRQTISIPVLDDKVHEGEESFFVQLGTATGATLGTNLGRATIRDNDAAPHMSINDVTVSEKANATSEAKFTVKLSAASAVPVTVDFATSAGTATSGADYQSSHGTLTFLPGETKKTIVVAIRDDLLHEGRESLFVNLTNSLFAAIVDGQGLVTVKDNDKAPSLSINDVSVVEGSTAEFVVRLSSASGQAVTVQYATANGSADSSRDFSPSSGTVTFAPGETTKTLRIATSAGETFGTGREFQVHLSQALNALFADKQALAIILDQNNP